MLCVFVLFCALCTMGMSMPLPDFYSYSIAAGDGYGTEFSTAHEGRITGIKVWEYTYYYGPYINAIQIRYDNNWTEPVGVNYYGNGNYGYYGYNEEVMTLFENEYIVQVSGKYYSGYISELMFVSNHGRSMKVGQPNGNSFNMYPTHDGSELRFLSGRQNGNAVTSIGAHWAMFYPSAPISNATLP